MSASGYISPRPGVRAMRRISDNALVLVNLHLARTIEPVAGGVRVTFGSQPSEHLDVKLTVDQLAELVALWQAG